MIECSKEEMEQREYLHKINNDVYNKLRKSHPELNDEDKKKFWNLAEIKGEDECWGFKTSPTEAQYHIFTLKQKQYFAHRISYLITYGSYDISLCVCHKCDNPHCINPKHLFLGTNLENHIDRDNKDRGPAKFTKKFIKEIREKFIKNPMSIEKFIEFLSIDIRNSSMNKIINNETYVDNDYIPPKLDYTTDEDVVRKIRELAFTDIEYSKIAKMFSLSETAVSSIIRNDRHKDENYTPPPLKIKIPITNEVKEKVKELKRQGLPNYKIAETLNIGKTTVNRFIKRFEKEGCL